jgi:hypothetical protein
MHYSVGLSALVVLSTKNTREGQVIGIRSG